MNYSYIIKNQIETIRDIRNKDIDKYPRCIETLWLFIRNPDANKLLEEHKQEFNIPPSQKIDVPDLTLWDKIFEYTLSLIDDYEGVS